MPKVVLITDDPELVALREFGGLPESWLADVSVDQFLTRLSDGLSGIVPSIPEWWLPAAGIEDKLGDEMRRLAFQHLTGVTVCRVAVLGAKPSIPPALSPTQLLTSLRDWHTRFRKEHDRAMSGLPGRARHVLVLVCLEPLSADSLAELQALLQGDAASALFDARYVMLHQLAGGDEPGSIFQSRHVWPLPVAGLLKKLLIDSADPVTSIPDARAWRYFQILPQIAESEWPEVRKKHCDSLFRRITSLDFESESSPVKFRPQIAAVSGFSLQGGAAADFSAQPWLAYDPQERLADVCSERRWKTALERAGDKFAVELSKHVIAREPAVLAEVRSVWRAVHVNPGVVTAALENHELLMTPHLEKQLDDMQTLWNQLLDEERQRTERIEETTACAACLSEAQHAFVPFWFRIVAVLSTTLCLGYLAMAGAEPWLGGRNAIGFAIAAGIGSIVAGFWSLDLERKAGRRGQLEIERQLAEIDGCVGAKHGLCQKSIDAAHVFGQRLWAAAAGKRLRQLLERVQMIFHREFRDRHSIQRPDEAVQTESIPADNDQAAYLRQQQRTLFTAQVGLRPDREATLRPKPANEEVFERFVVKYLREFRHELWPKFCEMHDRQNAGHFPARHLVPEFRDFIRRVEAGLFTLVVQQSVIQLSGTGIGAWTDSLQGITTYQRYFTLMSCMMLSQHAIDSQHRSLPQVYLRGNIHSQTMSTDLRCVGLSETPTISELLNDLPLVGFVFQEMPVRFAASDGVVVVAPWTDSEKKPRSPDGGD